MQDDLAKTIAAACLDHIQARPDSPSVDELADVVRPILEADAEPFSLAPDDLYAAALKDLYGVDPSTDTVTIAPDGTSNDPNYAKTGHISDPTIWGLPTHPSTQKLPWDKLRDPITDGPEHASTQKLHDARRAYKERIHEDFWETHERAIRGEIPEAWGTREGDVCLRNGCQGEMIHKKRLVMGEFAGGGRPVHKHHDLKCTYCGFTIEDVIPTPEGGNGE